jgi:hypothetical protein
MFQIDSRVYHKERFTMSWKRIALVVPVAAALSVALHAADRITPPSVPTDIEVTGYKPILRGHAIGTQNYICAPAATASGLDWLFIGPQATLFDDYGQQIATHFQSTNPFPGTAIEATWEHSRDTSAAWAVKDRGTSDPAYVSPGAIEWLRLRVTGQQLGPTGGNKLTRAVFIQRVNTVGGVKPPSGECTAASLNTRRLVPYEADYYFYE